MSQDYTVAKELASLKEIKQSAEQRISKLSLNALNYVDDHRLHKSGGGTGGGVLVCTEDENRTLDKTWNEINNANLTVIIEGKPFGKAYVLVTLAMNIGGTYTIQGVTSAGGETIYPTYSASTADDYPVLD